MVESRQSSSAPILPPKPQTFGLPTRPAAHAPAAKRESSPPIMVDEGANKRRSRIEIPLPCRPGPYRPGDGPPSAPLRILLQNDSNAIIHDKRVLPGDPLDGKLSLQMFYMIGWPDLPAARVAINAKYIFDYVSPRTLEDYEYRLALEREEKERIAEEQAFLQEAQDSRPDDTSAQATAPAGKKKKKKKGRPSKALKLAQKIEEETSLDSQAAAEMEAELPPVSGGPSLSTPKKKLAGVTMELEEIQDTEEIEDSESEADKMEGDDEDDEVAILKQLHGMEETKSAGIEDDHDGSEGDDSDELLEELDMVKPHRNLTPQKGPSPTKQPLPAKVTPILPPARYQPRQGPTIASSTHTPKQLSSKKETPIPPPSGFSLRPEPASAPPPRQHTLMSYGFTPAGRSSGKWPSAGPATPATSSKTERPKFNAKKQPPENPPSKKRKRNDGSALHPLPPLPPLPTLPSQVEDENEEAIEVAVIDDGNQEMEEEVWEVKGLEGDAVQTDPQTGRTIRLYLVRWKGNWPPEQNPTWEPEENIERALVRKYLKRKDKKEGKRRTSSTPSSSLLRRKYSSVAEAFEDEEHEEDASFSLAGSNRGHGGDSRTPTSATRKTKQQQWPTNHHKQSQRSSPAISSLGPRSNSSGGGRGSGLFSEHRSSDGGGNHGLVDNEDEEEERFLVTGDDDGGRRQSGFGSAELLARELEASFGSSARR